MTEKTTGTNRRDFLKLAGTAPAAAAALAVTADDAVADEVSQSEGLRSTEHTQKYLKSARF